MPAFRWRRRRWTALDIDWQQVGELNSESVTDLLQVGEFKVPAVGTAKDVDNYRRHLYARYLALSEEARRKAEGGLGSDEDGRSVSRCRGLFELANMVLPRAIREDALDEWMDEIHCAVEAGLPVRQRVLSILFRSLPKQALRARFPVRARRGEG